jgi:hypothetical protein
MTQTVPPVLLGAAALALLALTPTAAQAQTPSPFQVVMSGLDNPYGLAFGPDGSLYVAEAGTGGASTDPGFVNGAGDQVYFGDTGAVSRLENGVQTRVVSGLPSLDAGGGSGASGLSGLAFSGGQLYGVFGFGGTEAQRSQLVSDVLTTSGAASTNAGDLGQVVRLNAALNTLTPQSDLVPYETQNYAANNPGGTTPEANPYALSALSGGGFAVSDGGGNVVLQTPMGGGAPSLLSALPALKNTGGGPPFYQSVPTALAQDPQGKLYAGEFTGYPFPVGGASVLSLDPKTHASSVFASGFTTITGMTFGANGDLYVLDLTTNGYATPNRGPADLFQFDPATGTRTLLATLAPGSNYTNLIAGPGNALYLSSQGSGAGDGEVLRFDLPAAVPEASTTVSFGLLLALGGLVFLSRRKRAASAV